MKVKKSVKKKVTVVLIILFAFIALIGGYFAYKTIDKNEGAVKKSEVVDKIEGYGYKLEKDAPKAYKVLFGDLTKVLKKDPVDEEAYAKLIAQMMVVDFYNIENKMSKNDIGGSQFVYKDYRKNFVLEASETTYKYVDHNLYENRKQDLPEVVSSEVVSIEKEKYSYKKISDDNSYKVTVLVKYKKDMGYPTKVVVKLLHSDKLLEVYYMK